MKPNTIHLNRTFVQLYSFSNAWAYLGAAIPALARGITWLGILCLAVTVLMIILGVHPRTARARNQAPLVVWSYVAVVMALLIGTWFVGWLTGAIHNTLWLVYFASLLILYGVTLAAFIRSIRRPLPSSQGPGTQSSQGPAPGSPAGQGIGGRPKSR